MSTCQCHCNEHSTEGQVRAVLMSEHRVIERVLDAVERMLQSGAFDKAFLLKAIDFLRNFADGCHHAKEEECLFPELERTGMPRAGGPIGCMLHEHDAGRTCIGNMLAGIDAAANGDAAALAGVRSAARDYICLLRQHIQKEDNILFVVAENVLSARQKSQLLDAFERLEHGANHGDRHGKYVAIAEELARWNFSSSVAAV
ncbi:MAG: hemerythrin [Planctomycetota bacterium]|nr:MAG: hemerythrin [Planctomycetota bacterium]